MAAVVRIRKSVKRWMKEMLKKVDNLAVFNNVSQSTFTVFILQ